MVSSTTDTGLAEAPEEVFQPRRDRVAVRLLLGGCSGIRNRQAIAGGADRKRNVAELSRRRERERIPVVVVNARMSPRSFRRLSLVAGAARRLLFRHVTRFAVQEKTTRSDYFNLVCPPQNCSQQGRSNTTARHAQQVKIDAPGDAVGVWKNLTPDPLP